MKICFKCDESKECPHEWAEKPVCDECKATHAKWFRDNGIVMPDDYPEHWKSYSESGMPGSFSVWVEKEEEATNHYINTSLTLMNAGFV